MREKERNLKGKNTFNIPKINWNSFETKMKRLQRRAEKLDCGKISYKILREYQKEDTSKDFTLEGELSITPKKLITYYEIKVSGDKPKLEGWIFVAKLEHDPDIGTFIKVLPDETLPQEFRDRDRYNCDHCKKDIFRRDTFVVRNENNGDHKQVGRQCLKDFIGHQSPEKIAQYSEFLAMLEGIGDEAELLDRAAPGFREAFTIDLKKFLAGTVALIREYGWTSRSDERTNDHAVSTAGRAWDWAVGSVKAYRHLDITDADKELAEKAVTWAANIKDEDTFNNDYLYNIKLLALAEMTDYRKSGFAASIIASYKKTMARKRAKQQKFDESDYFGKVGERIEIGKARLVFTTSWESNFGTTHLYKFEQGNYTFVWFTSKTGFLSESFVEFIDGNDYFIEKATIKEHSEYKKEKQTILTRCIFKEVK